MKTLKIALAAVVASFVFAIWILLDILEDAQDDDFDIFAD